MSSNESTTQQQRGIGRDIFIAVTSAVVVAAIMVFSTKGSQELGEEDRKKIQDNVLHDSQFQQQIIDQLQSDHAEQFGELNRGFRKLHSDLTNARKDIQQVTGITVISPEDGVEIIGGLVVKSADGRQILVAKPKEDGSQVILGTSTHHLDVWCRDKLHATILTRRLGGRTRELHFADGEWSSMMKSPSK